MLVCTALIYEETLYGEAPFASTTFSELESKVRNSNPVVVSEIIR